MSEKRTSLHAAVSLSHPFLYTALTSHSFVKRHITILRRLVLFAVNLLSVDGEVPVVVRFCLGLRRHDRPKGDAEERVQTDKGSYRCYQTEIDFSSHSHHLYTVRNDR